MNTSEINEIESSLEIKLPDDYVEIVTNYPLRFGQGTCDYFLWDQAEKIISENLRLRKEGRWNSAWFLIGDDGAGWQHVVNLREERPKVKDVEFEDIRKLHDSGLTIPEWVKSKLDEFRDDGIDIGSPDDPRTKADKRALFKGVVWITVAALAITAIIFCVALIYQWIKFKIAN